jgi:hypothetical protein
MKISQQLLKTFKQKNTMLLSFVLIIMQHMVGHMASSNAHMASQEIT